MSVKDVAVGDFAASRDEVTGRIEWKRVTHKFVRRSPKLVKLWFALAGDASRAVVETLQATPEHPFYVDGKGWVSAGELGIGTSIVTRAGPPLVVVKVEWQEAKDSTDGDERSHGFAVYNFSVDEFHSYFVGITHGGAWVHNSEIDGTCGTAYPGNAKYIRRDNFPQRPRGDTVERLNRVNPTDANGNHVCAHCGNPIISGKPSPEHNPPLVDSWNNKGFNSDQQTRIDLYNDTAIGWAHLKCQQQQGGKMRGTHRYNPEVGSGYSPRPPKSKKP